MTFRTSHDFKDGANVLGAQLAHCAHCGTLRITDESRHPQPRFVLRVRDQLLRDGFDAPPCLSAVEAVGAKERVAKMNAARSRDAALRNAMNAAPVVAPEVEVRAPQVLINFPWYSDMAR